MIQSLEHISGLSWPTYSAILEPEKIVSFATAIGEINPIYHNSMTAKAAGFRDIPAPPTYLFCIDFEQDRFERRLADMGIGLEQILHVEQSFSSIVRAVAGDEISFTARVSDCFLRKGGALLFVRIETQIENRNGPVGIMCSTMAARLDTGAQV